ncbi:MAG: radical SAM protein [Candidatus Aegiribacteria sp.]
MTSGPGYLRMLERGELKKRVELLEDMLRKCRLCVRACGVDRLKGEKGFCGAGATLEVASSCVHTGEEPVLTGKTGVGNVFLGRCNMKCVFCQNHSISQPAGDSRQAWLTTPEELAEELLRFQKQGCPTAGFVSPTHHAPRLFRAVAIAARKGLRLPVIYNTSGYDSPELLRLLDGMVDIYMPDFKYWDPGEARRYSEAPGYRRAAMEGIREMHRQVGDLRLSAGGTAEGGLLVRLLVLPGGVSGTERTLEFLAKELGTGVFISLMSQYYPAHRARRFPPLNRRLMPEEYASAVRVMEELGFENGWVQDPVTSPDSCLPGIDFPL